MKAAARLTELLITLEEDLSIRRKNPYLSDAILALPCPRSDVTNEPLTEAVYIPFSLAKDVRSLSINLYQEGYYLDVIAKELGVVIASKVLISR